MILSRQTPLTQGHFCLGRHCPGNEERPRKFLNLIRYLSLRVLDDYDYLHAIAEWGKGET